MSRRQISPSAISGRETAPSLINWEPPNCDPVAFAPLAIAPSWTRTMMPSST